MVTAALRSTDGDLNNLGLRTLEFWVDNLNPEYLYPVLAGGGGGGVQGMGGGGNSSSNSNDKENDKDKEEAAIPIPNNNLPPPPQSSLLDPLSSPSLGLSPLLNATSCKSSSPGTHHNPQLTELMTALSKHLRPAPYPYGMLALRVLGKMGGRNRRFLRGGGGKV